ncbi:MAG: SRPBCC family protein [Desulfobacterales bacterium]|nr:SRPBCC family protein [Desulfobacterales bacterium]MDJ0855570.1 SRPBCC family protein [Desulfobacterales bacterium]MDJ0888438.1 SRPBCC family protein [Desulfobacterales bacterium]
MIVFTFEFQVARPIEDVFALIADVADYHRWAPSNSLVLRDTTITSPQREGLGLTFVDKVRFGGKSIGEVVRYAPPETFVIEQTTYYALPFFTARFVYRLRAGEHGTHVTHTATARVLGVFKPFTPILRNFIRRERTMTCEGLARELESAE